MCRWHFIATRRPTPFSPSSPGPCPRPPAKSSSTLRHSPRKAAIRFPPLLPPAESRWSEAAKRYPLEFLSRKSRQLHELHLRQSRRPSQNGIALESGARNASRSTPKHAASPTAITVRVFNDRGSLRLTAQSTAICPPGVVAGRLDWAKLSRDAVNVNALTSERLTDIGAGATFYSTLVEVAKNPL